MWTGSNSAVFRTLCRIICGSRLNYEHQLTVQEDNLSASLLSIHPSTHPSIFLIGHSPCNLFTFPRLCTCWSVWYPFADLSLQWYMNSAFPSCMGSILCILNLCHSYVRFSCLIQRIQSIRCFFFQTSVTNIFQGLNLKYLNYSFELQNIKQYDFKDVNAF